MSIFSFTGTVLSSCLTIIALLRTCPCRGLWQFHNVRVCVHLPSTSLPFSQSCKFLIIVAKSAILHLPSPQNRIPPHFLLTPSPAHPPPQTQQEDSCPLSSHSSALAPPQSCPYRDYTAPAASHTSVAPGRIAQIARPAVSGFPCLNPGAVWRVWSGCVVGVWRAQKAFGVACALTGGWRGVRGGGGGRERGFAGRRAGVPLLVVLAA